MKNLINALLKAAARIMFVLAFIVQNSFAQFSGGTGTSGDPYQVTTLAELQLVGSYPSSHFILMNDIDATDTENWNSGTGFVPIGSNANNFTGTFDGQGHVISNLFINRPTGGWQGLFGVVYQGTVQNVGLVGGSITAGTYTGALVGVLLQGTVKKVFSSVEVSGGQISPGALGGLVGQFDLYSYGEDIYAAGNVNGYQHNVGGLVGAFRSGSTIKNAYSAGQVTVTVSSSTVGGLLGSLFNSTLINGFYDQQTSGQNDAGKGTGKTTAEMKTQSTFTGFDFNSVWNIQEGTSYPFLQNVGGAPAPTTGLVSHWSAEGNANDEVGSNHGTVNGATFVQGIDGQAFHFDGSSYVEVPNSSSLTLNAITISAWVKFDQLSGSSPYDYPMIVSKGGNDGQGWDWSIYLAAGSNQFRFAYKAANGSTPYIDASASATTGVWYHVVATHDGSTMKLYVNGTLQVQASGVSPLSPSSKPLYFGRESRWNCCRLRGAVDEIKIYNTALSDTEVSEISSGGSNNQAPVASAGNDQSFDCVVNSTEVTLDGSGSSDADNDDLTYSWVLNGSEVSTDALFTTSLGGGTNVFTLTVSDGQAASSDDVTVVVNLDEEAPVPDAETLADVTGECGVTITEAPTATDACSGTIVGTTEDPFEYSAQGTYTITWNYTDAAGNTSQQTQKVIIEDNTAPSITSAKEVITLWPPNHKYETISLSDFGISVADNCSDISSAALIITKVTSDEAEDSKGNGDGNTKDDIVIANDYKSVELRSERQGGGNGRVYTIYASVSDGNGNVAGATFKVHVPHNKKDTAVKDDDAYIVTGGIVEAGGSIAANNESGANLNDGELISNSLNSSTETRALPESFELNQNYPNPFNPTTNISFAVAEAGFYTLKIYNTLGQAVAELVNEQLSAGYYNFGFDASKLSSGIYVYTLTGNNINISKKMILMK